LKRLGVEVIGDIIRLRAMCREVDSTNRKNELKQIITSGSKSRLGTSQNNAVARKPKARLVYVSWKHFDKKSQRYVLVKAKRGGGLAKFAFPHSAEKDTVHRVILSDGEDDNVSEVDSGVLDLSEQFSLPVGGLPSFSTHSTPIGNPTQGSRHLIGSSEERRQLNFQIERAVQESTCY